jgi:hypothetical protein
MPLTRDFKETVQARLQSDRKYRKELLREDAERLLAGISTPERRSFATLSTRQSSRRTNRPAKSLMRMPAAIRRRAIF